MDMMTRRRAMMGAPEGGSGSDIPLNVNLLSSSETGYRTSRALNTSSNSDTYSGKSYISNYLPVNQTDVFEVSSVRANTGIHFYDENKTFISARSSGSNTGVRYLYKSGLSALTPNISIPASAAFVRITMNGSSINASHYYKRIQ